MQKTSYQKTIERMMQAANIQVGPGLDIEIKNSQFYKKVLAEGSLGLGESYMDGWWESAHIDVLFYKLLKANFDKLKTWNLALSFLKAKIFNLQTKHGAKKVAKEHYNLSTNLFFSFLDPYNQYTCGYFKETQDLNIAQEKKLDLICRKLNLRPTDKVLDIGCGWGGFAKYASEHYGCHVTGVTISTEQAEFAKHFTNGLPVEIQVRDYRDLTGTYDKVLVCGMIEHVGYKNYKNLFKIVNQYLTDDGIFLLHTIGNNTSITVGDPWLSKYIFPGGMLPSLKQLTDAFEDLFILEDLQNFGVYYDRTLLAWFKNFEQNWPTIKADFDERFYRMWKYYLLQCAAIFRSRKAQLWQIVLTKNGLPKGFFTES